MRELASAELEAFLAMTAERFPDDDLDLSYTAADEARDDAAMAAMDRGEYVSHEAVCDWIRSWGTPHQLPRPKIGD